MTKRIIIGLCGQIGSGKTTAAQELVANGFMRMRFAGPLKAMAKCIGLNDQQVDGDLKETPCDVLDGMTPRRFMQLIGTEFGRQMICDDLWIRVWKNILDTIPQHISVVVDDVRFLNEAMAIREKGGLVVRVERELATLNAQILKEQLNKIAQHSSEEIDFPADHTIINNGTIKELYNQLPVLVRMAMV